jgi:hypothetical protein
MNHAMIRDEPMQNQITRRHIKPRAKAIASPEPLEPVMWAIASAMCAAMISLAWLG